MQKRQFVSLGLVIVMLLMVVQAGAATLISDGTVQPSGLTPYYATAQDNENRVQNLLDNNLTTYYNFTGWNSKTSDGIPELAFYFDPIDLNQIWIRNGNQNSWDDYYNNARPTTIRVELYTSYGSYSFVYAMDDSYNTAEVSSEWNNGYQVLPLPYTISEVGIVEIYITGWTYGSTDRNNLCITDILFEGTYNNSSMYDYYNDYPTRGYATLNQRLSTRSGPGTHYDGLGTYNGINAGTSLLIISREWDSRNGIWWVQVEFDYGGEMRRAYTGVKRFDDFDLNTVWEENGQGCPSRTNTETVAYYGPGTYYSAHKDSIPAYTYGEVLEIEEGYAQFEFEDSEGVMRRVWLPLQTVDINY